MYEVPADFLYHFNGINSGEYYINYPEYELDKQHFIYYQVIKIFIDEDDGVTILLNECYPNKNTKGVQTWIKYKDFIKNWIHERAIKLKEIEKN